MLTSEPQRLMPTTGAAGFAEPRPLSPGPITVLSRNVKFTSEVNRILSTITESSRIHTLKVCRPAEGTVTHATTVFTLASRVHFQTPSPQPVAPPELPMRLSFG